MKYSLRDPVVLLHFSLSRYNFCFCFCFFFNEKQRPPPTDRPTDPSCQIIILKNNQKIKNKKNIAKLGVARLGVPCFSRAAAVIPHVPESYLYFSTAKRAPREKRKGLARGRGVCSKGVPAQNNNKITLRRTVRGEKGCGGGA